MNNKIFWDKHLLLLYIHLEDSTIWYYKEIQTFSFSPNFWNRFPKRNKFSTKISKCLCDPRINFLYDVLI